MLGIINKKRIYRLIVTLITLSVVLSPVAYSDESQDKEIKSSFKEVESANVNSDLKFNSEFPEFNWWENFNDPYLTSYINKALDYNHDIKIAKKRIEESRALVRESLGYELPSISINPSYTRQQNSYNLTVPSIQQFEQAGPKLFAPGSTVNIFNMPLSASYEADIWLKNRNRTQAQKEQFHIIENNYDTTVLLVSTEIANTYFKLISTDKLIGLQEKEKEIVSDNLKLTQSLYDSGLVSEFEMISVRDQLLNVEKALDDSYLNQKLLLHQLAFLMGDSTVDSEKYLRKDFEDYKLFTNLDSGVPSELIARRPDIRAAESSLKQAKIQVKIARKEFLPSIMLSGQFGYASTKLSNLFDWKSHLAAFTASVAQSVFSGGSKRARLRAQKYNYEAVLENYHKTILQSFKDVDDSIASYKQHFKQNKDILSRKGLSEDNLGLIQSKYDQGLLTEFDVNNAELNVISISKQNQNSKLSCFIDYLSVVKSLGGGF